MQTEGTVEERLERLERLIVETRFDDNAIVGTDYVAAHFNCSETAVVRGRFGTDRIKRIRHKPLGFRKGDVHRVLRELDKTPAEKAADLRAKAKRKHLKEAA